MSALDDALKARGAAEQHYLEIAKEQVRADLMDWAQNLFTQAPEFDLIHVGVERDPESGIGLCWEYACNQERIIVDVNREIKSGGDGSERITAILLCHELEEIHSYRDLPRWVYEFDSYQNIMWAGAPEGSDYDSWKDKSHVNWIRRHKDALFQMVDWKVADIWLVSTGEGVVLDIETYESEY